MPHNFLLVVRLRDIKFTTMKEEKIAHLQIFLSNKKKLPTHSSIVCECKKKIKNAKRNKARDLRVYGSKIWTEAIEFDCWKEKKKDYETTRAEWSWGKQRNNLQFVELTFACVGATWERAWKVGKFSSHTHTRRGFPHPEISSSKVRHENSKFPHQHHQTPSLFVCFFRFILWARSTSTRRPEKKTVFSHNQNTVAITSQF